MTPISLLPKVQQLVLPYTVAIYSPLDTERVEQTGTGVLVQNQGFRFLVTAKHCLFGETGDENPGEKAIFLPGHGLTQVGDLQRNEVHSCAAFDLALVVLDEVSNDCCLPASSLPDVTSQPAFVTMCGYLVRDFRRNLALETLAPQPFIYSNVGAQQPEGFVGLKYEKNRNKSTMSGRRVMAPIPRGLSGGPMLDSNSLESGIVRVVGVFTDKPAPKGVAFGESSAKVRAMMDSVVSDFSG